MLQGMRPLRNSHLWDKNVDKGLHIWLSEYYTWLITSKLGDLESKAKNNHGTFYDVQALFLLDHLGKYDEAKEFVLRALISRIENGILPTGVQPFETERPTSWFYSIFNLQGLFMLAERADHYGIDAWNYVGSRGQSIQKAVDYLLPFALKDGEGWPFPNIKGFEMNDYVKILELSYIIYKDKKYLEAIEVLRPKAKAEQAAGLKLAKWEDNYLCDLALLTNRNLWTYTIHIQPYNFHRPKFDALGDEINRIYANKVVQGVGLCICLFDILNASEEIVHYGDGASYARVVFRLVVFRPFIGEIIEGKVSSNTSEGVKVSLGYFDDILIPTNLDDFWRFDYNFQVWVRLWDSHIPDNMWKTPEDKYLYMYMDKDQPIKFRVIEEKFTDTGSKGPPPKRTGSIAGQPVPTPAPSSLPSDVMIVGNRNNSVTNSVVGANNNSRNSNVNFSGGGSAVVGNNNIGVNTGKQAPYELIGSIAEVGLGLTSWSWG
ncbi:9017_t:CDS:2 [Entrophospora sp. SA101]|nr:9017_t:CDS:2 [Entrophospora sp. SA101]CAJ0841844.1 8591_t:CDS:2 [Entrophospora sp. SA101]